MLNPNPYDDNEDQLCTELERLREIDMSIKFIDEQIARHGNAMSPEEYADFRDVLDRRCDHFDEVVTRLIRDHGVRSRTAALLLAGL